MNGHVRCIDVIWYANCIDLISFEDSFSNCICLLICTVIGQRKSKPQEKILNFLKWKILHVIKVHVVRLKLKSTRLVQSQNVVVYHTGQLEINSFAVLNLHVWELEYLISIRPHRMKWSKSSVRSRKVPLDLRNVGSINSCWKERKTFQGPREWSFIDRLILELQTTLPIFQQSWVSVIHSSITKSHSYMDKGNLFKREQILLAKVFMAISVVMFCRCGNVLGARVVSLIAIVSDPGDDDRVTSVEEVEGVLRDTAEAVHLDCQESLQGSTLVDFKLPTKVCALIGVLFGVTFNVSATPDSSLTANSILTPGAIVFITYCNVEFS